MTDAEKLAKLKRFHQEMKARFGIAWEEPTLPGDGEEQPEQAKGPEKAKEPENAKEPAKEPEKAKAPAKPERTKPNRKENEFMLNMMVLRNALVAHGPAVRERAKRAGKYVWRDIRLMTRLVEKVQEALIETMPAGRDQYYTQYARHGHYELLMTGPVRNERMVLISDKHLAALVESAMENDCTMCLLEGNTIGRCPLRAALLEIAPPTEVEDGKWRKCEYKTAAGQLVMQEDVTI